MLRVLGRRMAYAVKRVDDSIKSVGTHDGSFHCDEALACYLLRLLPELKGTQQRSRRPFEFTIGFRNSFLQYFRKIATMQ